MIKPIIKIVAPIVIFALGFFTGISYAVDANVNSGMVRFIAGVKGVWEYFQ